MIVYHPGYDVHHCMYRIINILYSSEIKISFIDFYYIYPHLLKEVKNLPRPIDKFKKEIHSIPQSFEITPNARSLYFELKSIQDVAIQYLKIKEVIETNERKVFLNHDLIPNILKEKIELDPIRSNQFFKILINSFPKVNFNGKSGFKDRSGLMEFKYD